MRIIACVALVVLGAPTAAVSAPGAASAATPGPAAFALAVRVDGGYIGPLSLSSNGIHAIALQLPNYPGLTFYALPGSLATFNQPLHTTLIAPLPPLAPLAP